MSRDIWQKKKKKIPREGRREMITSIMELSALYFTEVQLGRRDFFELCVSIMTGYTWIVKVNP